MIADNVAQTDTASNAVRQPTPGPWQVIDKDVYAPWSQLAPFTDRDGKEHPNYRTGLIALVYGTQSYAHDGAVDGDIVANVHLIGAAPDLLAACELALGAFERNDAIDWSVLEAAIAKAKGGAL